jgi:ABC-type multidrug transport system fused ATPase/permease subunit
VTFRCYARSVSDPALEDEPPRATPFGVVTSALSLLTHRERAHFSWLMLLSLVSAVLDAVAVAALPALVGGMLGGSADVPGARLQWLVEHGRRVVGEAPALAGLALFAIYATKNAVLWWDTSAGARFSARASARASRDLFAYLMRRSWLEHAPSRLQVQRAEAPAIGGALTALVSVPGIRIALPDRHPLATECRPAPSGPASAFADPEPAR